MLSQQDDATLRSIDGSDEAEWDRGGVIVRARRKAETPTSKQPRLRVVR